jgi:hypothetical protein
VIDTHRKTDIINFPVGSSGKTAYFCIRLHNGKSGYGPWYPVFQAVVPSGGAFRLHSLPEIGYTFIMELDIICKPSAFKHGATMADIYLAFSTAVYDVMLRDDREKRLLIGFNLAGNPLEIMYNELDDGRINVFHAMPCRSKYSDYLAGRKNL